MEKPQYTRGISQVALDAAGTLYFLLTQFCKMQTSKDDLCGSINSEATCQITLEWLGGTAPKDQH